MVDHETQAHRIRLAPLVTVFLLLLLAATQTATPAAAQTTSTPKPPIPTAPEANDPAQDPRRAATEEAPRRLLDEVLMTVDNKVILRSEVQEEYDAQIEGALKGLLPGEKIDARKRALIYRDVKFNRMQQAIRAQAAWSLQGRSPEQIQRVVDLEYQRRQKEWISRFGSLNRMQQEMGLMSKSQFIVERREREQILQDLAEQDFIQRMRDRLALMITPKELRAYHRKRQPEMRTRAKVDLALVRFKIEDPDAPARTRERAAEAAAAWRQTDRTAAAPTATDRTAAELATQFGGEALPAFRNLTRKSAANKQAFILDFLEEPVLGKVSEPIAHGEAFYVMKMTALLPGNEFRFEDPAVQNQLRRELVSRESEKILRRLDRRDREKVFIWDAERDRR